MPFEYLEEKEAVKKAALIEENGYRFYSLLADRVESDSARQALLSLAADEKKHMSVIEKRFFPAAGFTDQITDEELGIEKNIERSGGADIFTRRIDVEALIKNLDSPRRALILALDTERYSVKFFDELSKKAKTEETARIYSALAEEERAHVTRIERLLADY